MPEAAGRRELTIRQRREMGLNLASLIAVAKELKSDGQIDRDTPKSEVAAAIAVRLQSKNAAAFSSVGEQGWEDILALIEQLLPLILMLIDLFT